MQAARYWGVWPPSKFYEASLQDQAIAVELMLEEKSIAAYQSKVDNLEHENRMRSLSSNKEE